MRDIIPPKRPESPPSVAAAPPAAVPEILPPAAPSGEPPAEPVVAEPSSRKRTFFLFLGAFVTLLVLAGLVAAGWYSWALQPVSSKDKTLTRVHIVVGSSPSDIGRLLKQNGLIRSPLAFEIYTRLTHTRSELQAGTYSISPSESTGDVVNHLVSGKVDQFSLTFFPGATLKDHTKTPEKQKTDVETVLKNAGYSQENVNQALAKDYTAQYPELFADKPAGTSLEGYVYGQTYEFDSSATSEDVISRALKEFEKQIVANNLAATFKARGLTLYQGITLASIIQREVSSNDPAQPSADQKQVAQIFYSRLAQHIPLGSDVTAYYGADQVGTERSVGVDTPYNTRIHTGLPPGPIATPSIGALEAAANPAEGDYLYFLSGDDNKMYFARTNDEHDANVRDHCKIKCAMP